MSGTFARLLRLAAPLSGWMIVSALLSFLTIGSSIGLLATSAYLISAAALHPSVGELGVAIVGVRFFGIGRACARYLERCLSHSITFRLLARLRVWFYSRIEPLAPARLLDYRSGDLVRRIVSDIEALQNFYVQVIAPPVVAVLIGVLLWFVLSAFNTLVAVTLLTFYVLAGVVIPAFIYCISRKTALTLTVVRADIQAQIVDGIQGAADILAFGGEALHQAKIATLQSDLAKLQRRMGRIAGLRSALVFMAINGAVWAMLLVAIPMVRDGRLNPIYLAVVALIALSGFEAVMPLGQTFQHIGDSLEAGRRLFALADQLPVVQDIHDSSPAPLTYDLRVCDLHFRYGDSTPDVLNGVDFVIGQGQCLALVGPSGAGKSTIAHLLTRFWEYDSGQIFLGEHPLRSYRQEDIYRLISVVSQDTHLFNTSIAENIRIARPTATDAEVQLAAQHAHLHDFIERLPDGYATYVGERGLKLSGGERQRIALARALLKDSPYLILDEATAHLDSQTEQDIVAALKDALRGRTILMITHRPAMLALADSVILLNDGRITPVNAGSSPFFTFS